MATVIHANGSRVVGVMPAKKQFTLAELYRWVDCTTVELITLADGRLMWLDEDGKGTGKQINAEATELLRKAGGIPGDFVVGTVLITASDEVD